VTELPGLNPRSPLMTVRPVLVTVLLATIANVVSVPSGGAVEGRTPIVFAATIKTASERARTNLRAPRLTAYV
jgi:hypothetical protein